jgi:DNA-binding PadR family transcriptional regulator
MDHRVLLGGLIRLHILHHAAEAELYGQWMIEELPRHGYRLSPGTLYPLRHGLENKGCPVSRVAREGCTARKYYRATPLGRKSIKLAIKLATVKAKELFGEIVPDQRRPKRARKR